MKPSLLFQLQLIITSITNNEAFITSPSLIIPTFHSTRTSNSNCNSNDMERKCFVVMKSSHHDDEFEINDPPKQQQQQHQKEPTNGSKEMEDEIIVPATAAASTNIRVNGEGNERVIVGEAPTEVTNEEKNEKIQKVQTGQTQIVSKEDLLANKSSSTIPISSIMMSEEIMEMIGDDILNNNNKVNSSQQYFESSPPLSFAKYLTMQDKRVPIVIRYSDVPGLRPYFLTTAKKIKETNPDVIVEKFAIPMSLEDYKSGDETTFEVVVDDRVIVGKPQCKWQGVSRGSGNSSSNAKDTNMNNKNDLYSNTRVFGMSVYVNMENVNEAIAKARRKRRPSTAYAQQGPMANKGVGLEILKGGGAGDAAAAAGSRSVGLSKKSNE